MKNLLFYLLVAVLGVGCSRVDEKNLCDKDSLLRPSNWSCFNSFFNNDDDDSTFKESGNKGIFFDQQGRWLYPRLYENKKESAIKIIETCLDLITKKCMPLDLLYLCCSQLEKEWCQNTDTKETAITKVLNYIDNQNCFYGINGKKINSTICKVYLQEIKKKLTKANMLANHDYINLDKIEENLEDDSTLKTKLHEIIENNGYKKKIIEYGTTKENQRLVKKKCYDFFEIEKRDKTKDNALIIYNTYDHNGAFYENKNLVYLCSLYNIYLNYNIDMCEINELECINKEYKIIIILGHGNSNGITLNSDLELDLQALSENEKLFKEVFKKISKPDTLWILQSCSTGLYSHIYQQNNFAKKLCAMLPIGNSVYAYDTSNTTVCFLLGINNMPTPVLGEADYSHGINYYKKTSDDEITVYPSNIATKPFQYTDNKILWQKGYVKKGDFIDLSKNILSDNVDVDDINSVIIECEIKEIVDPSQNKVLICYEDNNDQKQSKQISLPYDDSTMFKKRVADIQCEIDKTKKQFKQTSFQINNLTHYVDPNKSFKDNFNKAKEASRINLKIYNYSILLDVIIKIKSSTSNTNHMNKYIDLIADFFLLQERNIHRISYPIDLICKLETSLEKYKSKIIYNELEDTLKEQIWEKFKQTLHQYIFEKVFKGEQIKIPFVLDEKESTELVIDIIEKKTTDIITREKYIKYKKKKEKGSVFAYSREYLEELGYGDLYFRISASIEDIIEKYKACKMQYKQYSKQHYTNKYINNLVCAINSLIISNDASIKHKDTDSYLIKKRTYRMLCLLSVLKILLNSKKGVRNITLIMEKTLKECILDIIKK